ncbi:hypothetical protein ES708_13396 [subsurface metagenome]
MVSRQGFGGENYLFWLSVMVSGGLKCRMAVGAA